MRSVAHLHWAGKLKGVLLTFDSFFFLSFFLYIYFLLDINWGFLDLGDQLYIILFLSFLFLFLLVVNWFDLDLGNWPILILKFSDYNMNAELCFSTLCVSFPFSLFFSFSLFCFGFVLALFGLVCTI